MGALSDLRAQRAQLALAMDAATKFAEIIAEQDHALHEIREALRKALDILEAGPPHFRLLNGPARFVLRAALVKADALIEQGGG
jgi:hypothetical protein